MSAITVTVIVVGLTPTSVAFSAVVLHASEVVGAPGATVDCAVRPPPTFLPPPHAAADQHDRHEEDERLPTLHEIDPNKRSRCLARARAVPC